MTANPSAPAHPPSAAHDASARELIAARGGRVTRTRVAVLEVLRASHQPLNHDQICSALEGAGEHHDRVTLYRALDWLVEQDIATRVAGSDRAWKFELVRHHGHRHAHFHCQRCGRVLCLEEVEPALCGALPSGFSLAQAELVLHGACADCNTADPGAGRSACL